MVKMVAQHSAYSSLLRPSRTRLPNLVPHAAGINIPNALATNLDRAVGTK